VFLVVEFVLLCIWGVGTWATLTSPVFLRVQVILWSVLGAYLCFSLPVAVLYLLGRPPVMSLSPLWPLGPSPQERAYQREVGARPPMTDEKFYARFYEGSDIPVRVRRCLAYLDLFIERAHPDDMIGHAYDDLDWYDVVFRVEKQFGIRFTEQDYQLFTGTLGNLIELVHNRLRGEC